MPLAWWIDLLLICVIFPTGETDGGSVHTMVSTNITVIGNRMFSMWMPRNVFFIIVIPCTSGKMYTIFYITGGMTSIGRMMPEITSIEK